MDFSWNQRQRDIHAQMKALGDECSRLPLEQRLSALARAGVLGLPLPSEVGGGGLDLLTTAYAFEALGGSLQDGGVLLAAGAHLFGVALPIFKAGSAEQQHQWLPSLATGKILATVAATEPGSGSDISHLESVAEPTDTGFCLKGHKRYVTLAQEAGLFLVVARDGAQGRGLTTLLVPRDTPGVSVMPKLSTAGLAGAGLSEMRFDDCRLPADALVGKAGAGFSVFQMAMTYERALILAFRIGAMEKALSDAVRFARSRTLGGVAIAKHQAVSHRIARMKLRLETSRLLVYKAAWTLDQQERGQVEAALAKWHVAECALESAVDALKLRGGEGFLEDSGLSAGVNDALGGWIHSGTGDVMPNIVANWLGL